MNTINVHENQRGHNFDIVIYEDTTDYNYNEVLVNVKLQECYAYIRHDKDINEETKEPKKVHYHIILHYSNCRTIKTISNLLGVPSNYINTISSLKGAIRYLVHRDYDTKYQYSMDEIVYSQSFEDKITYAFYNQKTERDILVNMKNYIDSCHTLSMNDFMDWVLDNGYEKVYKKYYYVFKDLLLMKHV